MTRGPEIDRGWVGSVAQSPGPDLAPATQINHTHNVTKQNLQSLLHNDIYLPFNTIHLTFDCLSLKWLPITVYKSTWMWGFQQKFSSALFRAWSGCHQSPVTRLAAAPPPEPSRHLLVHVGGLMSESTVYSAQSPAPLTLFTPAGPRTSPATRIIMAPW